MQVVAVCGRLTRLRWGGGGGADHFVNQLLSLISLEKLLRSCQPGLGALLLLITSAIYDVCSFSSVTVSKTPRLSEMMQILPAKDFGHSCKGPELELLPLNCASRELPDVTFSSRAVKRQTGQEKRADLM